MAAPARNESRLPRRTLDVRALGALAPVAVVMLLFVVPLVVSLWTLTRPSGGDSVAETTWHMLTAPLFRRVLLNTVVLSSWTAAICLALGIPLTYFLCHASFTYERLGLMVVVGSMWLSILLRSFAWLVLLERRGPLAQFAALVSGNAAPASWLFTRYAVIIGMVHVLLPITVFLLWSNMKLATPRLLHAAKVLGISDTWYFCRIWGPASATNALATTLFIFLIAMGFYITPALLGGGQGENMTIATLIEEYMNTLGNWRKGLILSGILFVITCLPLGLLMSLRECRSMAASILLGATTDER